jgi:hypothetical protein
VNRVLPTVVVSRKMLPLNCAGHMVKTEVRSCGGHGAQLVHMWCTNGTAPRGRANAGIGFA